MRDGLHVVPLEESSRDPSSMRHCAILLQPELGPSAPPEIPPLAPDSFSKVLQRCHVALCIDPSAIGQELLMDDALSIPKDGQHDLLCGPFLTRFSVTAFPCDQPSGTGLLAGRFIGVKPRLVNSYDTGGEGGALGEHAKNASGHLQVLPLLCLIQFMGPPNTGSFLHFQDLGQSFVNCRLTQALLVSNLVDGGIWALADSVLDAAEDIQSELCRSASWFGDGEVALPSVDLCQVPMNTGFVEGVASMDSFQMTHNLACSHPKIEACPHFHPLGFTGMLHCSQKPEDKQNFQSHVLRPHT